MGGEVITRLLPPEEWPRLDDTELATMWRHMHPEDAQVVVVEDADEIIGCWALLRVVHVEGIWIAPAHRKRGSVARRLLRGMEDAASEWHAERVMTASLSEEVSKLLAHLGADKLKGDHYILPLRERN